MSMDTTRLVQWLASWRVDGWLLGTEIVSAFICDTNMTRRRVLGLKRSVYEDINMNAMLRLCWPYASSHSEVALSYIVDITKWQAKAGRIGIRIHLDLVEAWRRALQQ